MTQWNAAVTPTSAAAGPSTSARSRPAWRSSHAVMHTSTRYSGTTYGLNAYEGAARRLFRLQQEIGAASSSNPNDGRAAELEAHEATRDEERKRLDEAMLRLRSATTGTLVYLAQLVGVADLSVREVERAAKEFIDLIDGGTPGGRPLYQVSSDLNSRYHALVRAVDEASRRLVEEAKAFAPDA